MCKERLVVMRALVVGPKKGEYPNPILEKIVTTLKTTE